MSAREQIAAAEKELDEREKELLDGEEELNQAKEDLEEGRKEYEDARAEFEEPAQRVSGIGNFFPAIGDLLLMMRNFFFPVLNILQRFVQFFLRFRILNGEPHPSGRAELRLLAMCRWTLLTVSI